MSSPCREREESLQSLCKDGVLYNTNVEGWVADLQRGDGLVCVHQVRHDGLQRAVPLAGGSGTRTGVRPELTHLLVIRLLAVVKSQQTAGRRVLREETDGTNVRERRSDCKRTSRTLSVKSRHQHK